MSRIDVLRGAIAVALLATTLAGCGSGTGSSQTATDPVGASATVGQVANAPVPEPVAGGAFDLDDPAGLCAIFPAERAAAALGEPVGPGSATHSSTFANTSCHYDSAASDASITVWYHPGLVRTEWERQMAKIGMTPEMSVARDRRGRLSTRPDGDPSAGQADRLRGRPRRVGDHRRRRRHHHDRLDRRARGPRPPGSRPLGHGSGAVVMARPTSTTADTSAVELYAVPPSPWLILVGIGILIVALYLRRQDR